MGAISKKNIKLDTRETETFLDEKAIKRPNIDHLLKRINLERKNERNNTLMVIISVIIVISVISFISTQS
jgi:hypothetical protein